MKLAISAAGEGLNAATDPRFGRCAYFVLFDNETGATETLPNPAREAPGGAGVQAARAVADAGAEAVLTGNVGPNAHEVLAGSGVKMFTGATGSVAEALEAFRAGTLAEAYVATGGRKGGLRGMGGGMGRGGGGGRGGGMGGGGMGGERRRER